ncbi:ankyrin repeat domain-containing protein [Paenibacillus sp. 32O-W]|uniref:ankyrin repeat domain-containing protein n=1 Tax=Paenibacillus sp. 32O-W TaxID=1695218 RepID=UPI0011A62B50|nr:ankyrin repeat domain-containing protein [Paenibacillus sp. 32O-W]
MSRKSKRSIVISVRLDETTLQAVDLLVNSGLAQSRSEAASQFVSIGVQSSEELLLKAKALEAQVRDLKNEMLDAVKSHNLDKVKQLLDIDEKLKDAKTEEGQTAILMSAYYRANEIRELLLQRGAELSLYEAAAVGNTSRIRELVSASPELVNSHSFDGYTPLGLAAHFGNEEAAAYLLDNGADPNLKGKDGKLDNTPLHAAIAANHLNLVKLLLRHGTDIDSQCEGEARRGFTPLHVAAHFNRTEIIGLLLKEGANPRIVNSDKLTPEEYARMKGNLEAARLIMAAANPADGRDPI